MIENLTFETFGAFSKQQGKVIVKLFSNRSANSRGIEGEYRKLASQFSKIAKFAQIDTETEPHLAQKLGSARLARIIFFENGTEKDSFFEPELDELKERIKVFIE